MAKRTTQTVQVDGQGTPKKTKGASTVNGTPKATPSKLRSILKPSDSAVDEVPTPSSVRKVLFSNAVTPQGKDAESPTAKRRRLDSSARRKGKRTLEENATEGDVGDYPLDGTRDVALEIVDSIDADDDAESILIAQTPTKTAKPRGRPKGSVRKSPTPPLDMPPHEEYFYQNRPGGAKTSNNTLPSNALLSHDEYFAIIKTYDDPHANDVAHLARLHSHAFDQWAFELKSGFSICLYGYGSSTLR